MMLNQLLNALINRRATATPEEAKRIDDKLREVKTCANEDEMIGVLLGQKRPPTARELDHQTLRQRVVEKRQKIEAEIAHMEDVRRRITYAPEIAQEYERQSGEPYDPILWQIEKVEIYLQIWDAVLDLLDAHPEIIPYSYLAGGRFERGGRRQADSIKRPRRRKAAPRLGFKKKCALQKKLLDADKDRLVEL